MTQEVPGNVPRPTPSDVAKFFLRHSLNAPKTDEQAAEAIVEINGVRYKKELRTRWIQTPRGEEEVPHTCQSYYSHTDPTTGLPGPGWDYRWALSDEATAQRMHGKTFTPEMVESPGMYMPTDTLYFLVPIETTDS